VLNRTAAVVAELERRHADRDILLVSHGDTLAILQAGFLGVEPSRHRRDQATAGCMNATLPCPFTPASALARVRPIRGYCHSDRGRLNHQVLYDPG